MDGTHGNARKHTLPCAVPLAVRMFACCSFKETIAVEVTTVTRLCIDDRRLVWKDLQQNDTNLLVFLPSFLNAAWSTRFSIWLRFVMPKGKVCDRDCCVFWGSKGAISEAGPKLLTTRQRGDLLIFVCQDVQSRKKWLKKTHQRKIKKARSSQILCAENLKCHVKPQRFEMTTSSTVQDPKETGGLVITFQLQDASSRLGRSN